MCNDLPRILPSHDLPYVEHLITAAWCESIVILKTKTLYCLQSLTSQCRIFLYCVHQSMSLSMFLYLHSITIYHYLWMKSNLDSTICMAGHQVITIHIVFNHIDIWFCINTQKWFIIWNLGGSHQGLIFR